MKSVAIVGAGGSGVVVISYDPTETDSIMSVMLGANF